MKKNLDLIHISCDELSIYRARQKKLLHKLGQKYRLIDLFAGAGGMSLGFSESFGHIFIPVWANDFNIYAARTYQINFGIPCSTDDILEVVKNRLHEIPNADVVIGGPPCQGFSLLNKKRQNDPRKQLWIPFFDVLEHVGAEIFVMENVPQLLGSKEYDLIYKHAHGLGFNLAAAKLCAADYGVPQTRWRAFIIGCKFVDPRLFFPPKKTHKRPDEFTTGLLFKDDFDVYIDRPRRWRTVRDAIGDLPEPIGTEINNLPPPLDLHFGRTPTEMSMKRYQAIPKEGMNRFDLQKLAPDLTPPCWIKKTSGGTDLFGRLWWDRPAFTIRTEFYKPEKGRYLHPTQHRPITHREAARIQTFPDSFKFIGTKVEIAKQIGNAVPPLLASRIADCVLAMLLFKRSIHNGQVLPKTKKSYNGKNQSQEYYP